MDIRDFIDMDDDMQDVLFYEMSNTLLKDTVNENCLFSLAFNQFIEAGISLKYSNFSYDFDTKKIFHNISFTENDINIFRLIESLLTYSIITVDEYTMIKEEILNKEELQSYMSLRVDKISDMDIQILLLIDIKNSLVQYILEIAICKLVEILLTNFENEINSIVRDLTLSRLFVFRRYCDEYNIELLYNELFKGGEFNTI